MRIVFVSHSFPPPDAPLANVGGMQRVATELYAALDRTEGVALTGLVLEASWRASHLYAPFFMIRSGRRLKQLAESRAVDVVLFSSMVTASIAAWVQPALRNHGVKAATIVHGEDVTKPIALYQRAVVPRIFNAMDAVMPVSHATGRQCTERGLPGSKLRVVPNGVDLSRFPPLEARPTMRAELVNTLGDPARPLPEGALLLCSVGRQVKRKGFAWFVEHVMPRLPGDVHYWLAGDGPETLAIQAAAAAHGVADRVRLLGRVSEGDLQRLYRGADLFVMPNIPVPGTMEGFGVVMLEAGANGMPAIAARLEGIQDVIEEGENGHFVESGDVDGFVAAIARYDRDREALRQASERAAAYTAGTFSWEAVARRYVDALRTL